MHGRNSPYKISRGVQYQLLADIGSLTMHFPIFTCRLPSHSFNVQLKFIFKKKKITKFNLVTLQNAMLSKSQNKIHYS